jgi:hypothetical protein
MGSNMDDKLILQTAAAIQTYLAAQPNSADTLEGIHAWWIPDHVDPDSIAVTEAALEYLAAAGIVERVPLRRKSIWRACCTSE